MQDNPPLLDAAMPAISAQSALKSWNFDGGAGGTSSWSQMTLVRREKISIKGADSVSFDLYYDGALLKDGAATGVWGHFY